MKNMKWMALLILYIFVASKPVFGQELVSGWEGGPSYGYAFVSPVFSFPESSRNSFVIRPTFSYLYYNFQQGTGMTAVNSPGAGVQMGYRRRTRRLTYTITPGFEARRDYRSAENGQSISTTQLGATIQGDAFFQANTLTTLSVVSNYGTSDHYFWTRAGFARRVTNTTREGYSGLKVGTEINGQGNHDVRQLEIGGVFEVPLGQHNTSLQVRSGYAHLWYAGGLTGTRPYVGIGFYHHF